MKILLVSSYLPFPLYSGGHVRLYNLIKQLSKKHEITLICEKRNYQTEEDVLEIKKFCKKVKIINRKKQWSIANILKTGFSLYPFIMQGHSNVKMRKLISEALVIENFDVLHVETFYVMQNLPKEAFDLPVILVEHNVEYLVYKRFLDKAPFFVKPLLAIDVLKIKSWEQRFWKKATKLVAVSNKEKGIMKRKDTVVVPNGVDVDKYKVSSSKFKDNKSEFTILFIGDFKWMQNRDSMEWILKEIWPEIKSKVKSQKLKIKLKLWVVGKNIPEKLKLMGGRDVVFDENAPKETEKIYEKADILLSPIRIGGGTQYKILESMASGVLVITTQLGKEGIIASHGEILVGQTVDEIAKQAVKGIADNKLRFSTIKKARETIEDNYSWEKITNVLESVYLNR